MLPNAPLLGTVREETRRPRVRGINCICTCLSGWSAVPPYLRLSKDKMPRDELMEIVSRPDVEFTTKLTPIDSSIQFMAGTSNYKNKPKSAAELLFPKAL